MDSSESPVHGQQEGAAYNGHFECVCYHPLFLFNQFGDCEGAKLRSGNVHSADDWQEVLDPVVERYFTAAVRLLFRADAAFAKPEIYEYLETRQIDYAIRLPANEVLQRKIAHLLTRPTEGPSPKPIVSYHDFTYPTFPIWLNIPLSKSSAFFKPLSICETLAVGMAIITP